jgi:hypothetical protein
VTKTTRVHWIHVRSDRTHFQQYHLIFQPPADRIVLHLPSQHLHQPKLQKRQSDCLSSCISNNIVNILEFHSGRSHHPLDIKLCNMGLVKKEKTPGICNIIADIKASLGQNLKLAVVDRLIIVIRHTACTTLRAIKLAGDGVRDIREFLLLLFVILRCGGLGVLVEPVLGLLDSLQ